MLSNSSAAERAAGAVSVSGEHVPGNVGRHAELQRDRRDDRGVARVNVAGAAALPLDMKISGSPPSGKRDTVAV
jgi:hypothetical protein